MSTKFIPYQKLTRKKQQEIDHSKRGSWGAINPVTRCEQRSDAYNRKKENCRWKSVTRYGTESSGSFSLERVNDFAAKADP